MEEILASIQRIIVDDDDSLPRAPAGLGEVMTDAAAPAPRALGQAPERRVAGMDAPIASDPPGALRQASPGSSPAQGPELDATRRIDDADGRRREPEFVSAPLAPADPGRLADPAAGTGMADAGGLAASVAALTRLASIGQTGRNPELPLGDSGRTLEDVVRELLRPQLKEWLDAHLPQLVERLARDEIARLVREAQQR